MRADTQLAQEHRYLFQALLKMGHIQPEIPRIIGVHETIISQELRRNHGLLGYRL